MNNNEEYLILKMEWSKQINLHWRSFLDSKIIEMLFVFPRINDFLKVLLWNDASVKYSEEQEELTISFLHPDYDNPCIVGVVLYDTDYAMYLYCENRYTTFSSLFNYPGLDKMMWKWFLEFGLFSYIYDFQKLQDDHNIK